MRTIWLAAAIAVAVASWLLPPALAQEAARRKAVSFAILEDYDKGEDLQQVELDFELFKTLEVDTWRGSLGWDDYELSRGRFDFAWLHQFVERAARHRINLRPYLGYTPAWAAEGEGENEDVWNDPPEHTADWERFATAIARELARYDNVLSYEIYNEENVRQWWDGTAAAYASVLRHGAQAVRRGDPDATLIFGGLVFPDVEWVEAVCDVSGAARAFSVLPFHAYPETWTPADVTVENYLGGLKGFVSAADRACGPKAIWINETGFATTPGKSEREQAVWWVRAVATFLAAPRVEHIGIYEIKDLPLDREVIGDAPNYHLGLTRADRTKKLAFYTVDLLTDLLDTGTITVDDVNLRVTVVDGAAGELHHHLFGRPDGDRVLIVWDRTGSPTLRINTGGAVGGLVEFGLDGRPLQWDASASLLDRVVLEKGMPRIFRLHGETP